MDVFFDAINNVIQAIQSTPPEAIALVLGAAGVSILTQITKKLVKLQRERVVVAVFTAISFLFSLVDYLIQAYNNGAVPAQVLGYNTAILMGVAQVVYYYGVKPFNRMLAVYNANKDTVTEKLKEVEAINKVNDIEQPVIADTTQTPVGTLTTEVLTPKPVDAPKETTYTGYKTADF